MNLRLRGGLVRIAALLLWLVLVLVGGGIAAGLVLAWRLSEGPLDVTAPVRRAIGFAHLPVDLQLRQATLGWRGAADGGMAPVALTLRAPVLIDRAGRVLDRLDEASIALSPRALLSFRAEPLSIEAHGGTIVLHRGRDGIVTIAGVPLPFQAPPPPGAGAPPTSPPPPPPHAPPPPGSPPLWGSVQAIRLAGISVRVDDDALGLAWGARSAGMVLDRPPGGGAFAGRLDATLFARPSTGAGAAEARVAASLRGDGPGSALDATVAPVSPAAFALLLPALSGFSVPVGARLSATFDPSMRPVSAALSLSGGAGSLAFDGATAAVRSLAATLRLEAGGPGRPGYQSRFSAGAVLAATGTRIGVEGVLDGDPGAGGALAGHAQVTLDALPVASLSGLWPHHAALGARRWVLANMTAGSVRGLAIGGDLRSRDGLGGLDLATLAGGFSGENLAIHWLRPVPPLVDGRATLAFEGEDRLRIRLAAGRQLVGAPAAASPASPASASLDMTGTTMQIAGLTGAVQTATIDAAVAGRLADLVTLLGQKRLALLSKHPFPFADPEGEVAGRVAVTLPLDDRITIDQVGIDVHARLDGVILGDVALGRPLEDAALTLAATGDGLTLAGTGRFAGLPLGIAASLDFRAGPPDGVDQTARLTTTANDADISRAGLPLGGLVAGPIGIAAAWRHRRDGDAELSLDADLAQAAIETPLGWRKAAGAPASAHAVLELDGDRLAAIRDLDASGPGLDLATRVAMADGAPQALLIDRVTIGDTRASGRLDLPGPGDRRYRLALAGPVLDLGPILAPPPEAKKPADRAAARVPAPPRRRGPGWTARFRFGAVRLANRRDFTAVAVRAAGTGLRVAEGTASAAGPSPLDASVAAAPGGRVVTIHAADAGRLLAAFDVTDRIRGGTFALDATLPDAGEGEGVGTAAQGTMTLAAFSIDRAPVVARLLRDATLYGLADRAPQHGITVARLVVPFTWGDGVLGIQHARMSQAALGITAQGTIDTRADTIAVDGTVVPAYAVNTLPGRLPLVGRLFSPERGGGLFAMPFRLSGPLDDPRLKVNPLAAVVPGVLRDLLHP